MTPSIDMYLQEKERLFPGLFGYFRASGWSETWRAPSGAVDAEPRGFGPFPMHGLARHVLERFLGLVPRQLSIRFGGDHACPASNLMVVRPYDVEEYLLGERPETKVRPPAFPVCVSNGFGMFLREDWSTVTVSYFWGSCLVVDDLFEILDALTTYDSPLRRDPERWHAVTDEQVPDHIRLSIYRMP